MILALPVLLDLAHRCAPNVAPETLLAVAEAESGRDPLVIGVNGHPRRVVRAATAAAAADAAGRLIAEGADIDLGLGQINSRTVAGLRLPVADAFDPCRNLAASATVLSAGYQRSAARLGEGQPALKAALSLYNTGNPVRGLHNGYVARVSHAAARVTPQLRVPALAPATASTAPAAASSTVASPGPDPAPPPPAAWDVFARPGGDAVLVF